MVCFSFSMAGLAPTMLSSELRVAASRLKAKFCRLRRHLFQGAIDGQLDFVHQAGRLADVVGRSARFHRFTAAS
jgi:hypothetical protein